jgi:glutathione peroxidase
MRIAPIKFSFNFIESALKKSEKSKFQFTSLLARSGLIARPEALVNAHSPTGISPSSLRLGYSFVTITALAFRIKGFCSSTLSLKIVCVLEKPHLKMGCCSSNETAGTNPLELTMTDQSIYEISVRANNGEELTLESYRGRVLLIVNTASKCGFTGQYAGLQQQYIKYQERGFVVLAFPSNNFMRQEPGTNPEIREFCERNYRITFPIFEKIDVKGSGQHPLYAFLTSKRTNPRFSGKITWNFNKFLIGRDGTVLNRFKTRTPPEAPEVQRAIEQALA